MFRNKLRLHRHARIRAKLAGNEKSPRLSVFISLNHIYAQLIDDQKGHTLVSANDYEIGDTKNPSENASKVGELLAKKAKEKKIKIIIFDRGGYKYHGKIKALAESARKNGLQF